MLFGCNVRVRVLEAGGASSCAGAVAPVDTTRADAVVGDGTAASCTEDALNTALATGGIIRFRCGGSPLTLAVTAEKVIARDTVLDGGGTITLDGGGATRLFVVGAPGGSPASLTLQYLTLRGGYAAVTPASAGGPATAGGGAILQFGGTLVITDSVLRDNDASAIGPDEAGGAVCSLDGRLVIARTVLDGNRAGSGGAVAAIRSDFALSLAQLTNNQAVGQGSGAEGIGGALLVSQEGQSAALCQVRMSGNRAVTFGSAMHLQGIGGEPVTIEQAAILDNQTTSPTSGGPSVFLGILDARVASVTVAGNQGAETPGVWVNGGTQPAQAATIHFTNVTIADNRVFQHADVTKDGVGGALWIEGVVSGELDNCTLAGNLGEFGSGIVHPSQLIVRNTIIANQGTNVWNPQNCSDLAPTTIPASGDGVLQWPIEALEGYLCVAGARLADPQLGPLQDNGGFAPTRMPAPASPAVAAGVDCPATDARGRARAVPCTLGAVEADGTGGTCPSCAEADAGF
jgi:hypothetical protein